ncbi:MAG: hypothetical protein Q4A28_05420 [Brachymonas sp.]|nr:hypothetical protein [Brachymonas sp.]
MKPWIRKTILALALLIAGMVGVALWTPAYLFWVAAAIAPELTAKMVVKWSLYRNELIAKSFSLEEQKKNLEEQTIRIELGGKKYNIPVRYAYSEAIERRGYWPDVKKERIPVKAFSMDVLLPDLKPYYPEDDAEWKKLGHGKKLALSIRQEDGENWYFSKRKSFFNHQELYHKRSDDVYDLAYFEPTGGLRDEFFPLDENVELNIECTPKKKLDSTPSPGCSIKSNYKNGIILDYFFSRDYLKNWREIDRNLKSMLDSFEQEAAIEAAASPKDN